MDNGGFGQGNITVIKRSLIAAMLALGMGAPAIPIPMTNAATMPVTMTALMTVGPTSPARSTFITAKWAER
jgi:hypothetical protein